jgi:acylphosphatase
MKHINIIVFGRVQGVGFRHATKQQAHNLGLNGFVKNQYNGTVYIEAEGENAALNHFVLWCRQGPPYAEVDNLDVTDGEIKGFSGFETRY